MLTKIERKNWEMGTTRAGTIEKEEKTQSSMIRRVRILASMRKQGSPGQHPWACPFVTFASFCILLLPSSPTGAVDYLSKVLWSIHERM